MKTIGDQNLSWNRESGHLWGLLVTVILAGLEKVVTYEDYWRPEP
ncbi:hypothetical protein [Neobacillus niacini]|nr:hypothetical protein [Neobacillus niacini]